MGVFQACREAVQRAKQLGPISNNRVADLHAHGLASAVARGAAIGTRGIDRARLEAMSAALDGFRLASSQQAPLGASVTANADSIDRMAVLVQRFGYGNCGELSAVAFHYLRRQDIPGKVALVNWVSGNHMFVVAGMSPLCNGGSWDFDPYSPPAAWGAAAVWCDPWAQKCFDCKRAPWSMYARESLKKASGIDTDLGRRGTRLAIVALARSGHWQRGDA